MNITSKRNLSLFRTILWVAVFFSTMALVYHIRWVVPFLQNGTDSVVPENRLPFLWFIVQICTNIIFVICGLSLIKLLRKFRETGFFDTESFKVLDIIIISCICLAFLGVIQTIFNNIHELHINEWTSAEGIANLSFRSFTKLLIFSEPQTMYFLLAIILWSVKQFVTNALLIKKENETFV